LADGRRVGLWTLSWRIAKVVILASAPGKAFDDAVALFKAYPERFEVWCGIGYTGFDQPGFDRHAVAGLERCHRAGAAGGPILVLAPGLEELDPRVERGARG
jgi:hypothetical protein